MQMGGDWFYRSLLYWYYLRFISRWESKDHTDPAHCKKCADDLFKYTQWNQLTEKKMCRDLTALCIVKQSLNRPTRALIIKVRSFCQRPNVTLCLKEILLQSPFQCQIIFFILICIFFMYWTLLLSQRFCLSTVHKIIYFVSACSWLIRLQIFFFFFW